MCSGPLARVLGSDWTISTAFSRTVASSPGIKAGKLGGAGVVVVKVSKRGHDVRFDLPVIGERTLKSLRKAQAAVLAVEARRTILLDRQAVLAQAERQGLCLVAIETMENCT